MDFLSVLSKGSERDKILWTFQFYDVNSDGCISRDEMIKVASNLLLLLTLLPPPLSSPPLPPLPPCHELGQGYQGLQSTLLHCDHVPPGDRLHLRPDGDGRGAADEDQDAKCRAGELKKLEHFFSNIFFKRF